jgi:hypothetical protein
MDVALDSNVILNDPRMEGNAFHNLLDYLKKTDSKLILSKVVFDEVISRYPELLRPALHKAVTPVRALKNLVFDSEINIPRIDFDRETGRLKQKLLKPSDYVSSVVVDNFSDVRVEEVVRRGIQRIPPANGAGEELRDVIHWLMLLAYARTSVREIAFITNDKHFREATARQSLEKEVQENRASLHFYSSLDEFIKAEAPAPRNLEEADAFALYGKAQVLERFEIEARRFFPTLWPAASSVGVTGRDVRLVRGELYDVGPDSKFGELEFSGEIRARVTELSFAGNSYGQSLTANSYAPLFSGRSPSSVVPSAGSQYTPPYTINTSYLVAPVFSGQSFSSNNAWSVPETGDNSGPATFTSNYLISTMPNNPTSIVENVSEFDVKGTIVVSIRVVSGSVTNIETERFELGDGPNVGLTPATGCRRAAASGDHSIFIREPNNEPRIRSIWRRTSS